MSLNKIFSSKPKQIAQAALQVLSNVYGDLENVKIIVISDMQSTLNIAENFKQSLSGGCCILEESFDKFLKTNEDNLVKNKKFIDLIKDFDMVMIGYKSQLKLVDSVIVRNVLKIRKKKPIFFIDCGIPGNICVDIGKINNCYLFDLNDLEQLYTSWIQKNDLNHEVYEGLFDLELKALLNSFFSKFKFNLEQKMMFEKKIKLMLSSKKNDIKLILKNFLKNF